MSDKPMTLREELDLAMHGNHPAIAKHVGYCVAPTYLLSAAKGALAEMEKRVRVLEGAATKEDGPHVVLVLNDYEAANLRWLMRCALHSVEDGFQVCKGMNTGDWNGTVLWQIEQRMMEAGMDKRAQPNSRTGEWPFEGYGRLP